MGKPVTDETARTLRRVWFDYLDTIEPVRPKLHAYCLKLTGSVFDAEDLVQEALLRGFAATARGDFHRPTERVGNISAYLARVASNLWIDGQRRRAREPLVASDVPVAQAHENAPLTPAAGAALFERVAPQERAAVVLKDVFDFSLDEIANILSTTPGAVKSALSRGRAKLAAAQSGPLTRRGTPASRDLVERFIAAFNARDIEAITALLSETVVYEASGVGGEIGRDVIWLNVNASRPPNVAWERRLFDGEEIAIGVLERREGRKMLLGVSRLEEAGGRVSRHVGYYFTPETLAIVAEALGMDAANHGYHQDPETLERMIADTGVPWQAD
jgi:RNA polymerase sigma-70 factor, ECF subfamily